MRVLNKSKNTVLAENARLAESFFSRFMGLMGQGGLGKGQALILRPCNSIHSFFMRFAIDALFVDKQNVVVACLADMRPFRLSPIFWKAHSVIELPCGALASTSTSPGDTLLFE